MGQLMLKYHPILTSKEIFAANKVKFPHTDKALIVILTNRCNILAKGLPSLFLRFGTMTAHDFHIENLRPLRPAARIICSSRGIWPRGKYIYSASSYSVWCYGEPDRMHQRHPIWCQKPCNRGKVTVRMAHADIFENDYQNNAVQTAALMPVTKISGCISHNAVVSPYHPKPICRTF